MLKLYYAAGTCALADELSQDGGGLRHAGGDWRVRDSPTRCRCGIDRSRIVHTPRSPNNV